MQNLLSSLQRFGLLITNPILDGKVHRVKTEGSNKKNGWYVGRSIGENCFCSYGNWATGEKHKYPNDDYTYSEKEKVAWGIIQDATRVAEKEKHDEAAIKAEQTVSRCILPAADHLYIVNKNIHPASCLQLKENLILPIYTNTGILTGYQSIAPTGEKRYLSGMLKQGCCHVIPGSEDQVLICEGFSTGVTLNMATGNKILVALDCSNLLNVASLADKKYMNILICADNDHKTQSKRPDIGNPGINAAIAIKTALGINYVYPGGISGSDFNDMAHELGIKAVKDLIRKGKTLEVYKSKKASDIPPEIFNPPGVLKDIADYYNETAVKPQPLFAIAAGLILGSVVLGRRYVTNQQNYTSLYFVVAAKSGTGKDHIKQVVREILSAAELSWMEQGEGYTASNTVIKALERQALQLSFFEEIGQRLKDAGDNPKSLSKGVFRKLLDVWSSCHSHSVGETYSTGEIPRVDRPALTMVGITTPRSLTLAINDALIEQGFVNRILPFLSKQERVSARLRKRVENIPKKILRWIEETWIKGNLAEGGVPCLPCKEDEKLIPFSPAAIELLNQIEDEVLILSNHLERYHLDDMPSRIREIIMRVSLIVAVMDRKETITSEHVKWSHTLVWTLYDEYIKEIKQNVSGSDYEKHKLLALDSLRKRGEKGIRVSEMPKLSPWSRWPKKLRNEILDDLRSSGLADSQVKKTNKKGPSYEVWIAIQ